jgi:hypothetical protein
LQLYFMDDSNDGVMMWKKKLCTSLYWCNIVI